MNPDTQLQNCRRLVQEYINASKSNNNAHDIDQASRELTLFTKQEHFPELALHMLLNEGFDNEKLMLITTLLKNRFKFDFELLDSNKMSIYYNGLCEVAKVIPNSIYPAFSNIVQSLAYIYINIVSTQQILLEDFLKFFLPNTHENIELYNYYFKIAEQISSELTNLRVVVDDAGREMARNRISAQQINVLNSLSVYGERVWGMDKIQNDNIIQCFVSWCEMGDAILTQVPHHFVMHRLMQTLEEGYQSESALECLRVLIDLLGNKSNDGHRNAPFSNYQAPLFQYLGSHMLSLTNQLDRLIERKRYQEADRFLIAILEFLSKATSMLILPSENTHILLTKLVNYTLNQKFECYYEIMEFWQTLLEEASQSEQKLHSSFIILINQLYEVVCERCRLSNQYIQLLDYKSENKIPQNLKNPIHNRESSNEFFTIFSMFKGKTEYLAFVVESIQILKIQNQNFWSQLETRLYSLVQPIKKLKEITEHTVLLVNTFCQLTSEGAMQAPIAVKRTFLKVFKSFLSTHHQNEIFVKKLFYLISTCFGTPLLTQQAERAFCKGCEHNGQIMCSNAEQLITLVQHYPHHESIIKGIVSLLCKNEQIFVKFLPVVLNVLVQFADKEPRNINSRESLRALITAFRVLKESPLSHKYCQITKNFLRNSWSFLMNCLKNPQNIDDDEDPQVERTVKLLKMVMRCLKLQFAEFLQNLFQEVCSAFQTYPICSYIYLLEIAVTVFSSSQQFSQYILQIYLNFCQITISHLSEAKYIQKYSYLLDDFIGMHKRFFLYNASIVLESGQLPRIIQICVNLMGCLTPKISKAVYSFFETLFMVYWPEQFVKIYNEQSDGDKLLISHRDKALHLVLKPQILDCMQYVIAKMLEHLSALPPDTTRQAILDALLAELKGFPQENYKIWTNVLAELPPDIMLSSEKEKFLNLVSLPGQINSEQSCQAVTQLTKFMFTLNRRLIVAAKRQTIDV